MALILGMSKNDGWETLLTLTENSGHDVHFEKIEGHANKKPGHVSNEHERFNQLCDELAVSAVPN